MTTTQLSSGTSYTLEQRIAEGGMGAVYRGTLHSPAGERKVAIKRLRSTKQPAEDATARLASEARLVFQLNHANICQVLDLGTDGDEIYVVMEYVHGVDLRRLLHWLRTRGTPIGLAEVLYMGREIARALDYTHRRKAEDGSLLGLVHGDVTPGNVLLSVEGEVKLSDFGIARRATSKHDEVRGGTPGFMAPEAGASRIDHRADLYSLGATLWWALSRTVPTGVFDVRSLEPRADLSSELRTLIGRMIAESPGDRPMSAAAVETALATELARRHPGFTPAMLGAVVARACAEERLDADPIASPATLVSILDDGAARPGAPHDKTRTLMETPRARRRWVWPVLLSILGGLGAAAAWRLTRATVRTGAPGDAGVEVVATAPSRDAAVPMDAARPLDVVISPVVVTGVSPHHHDKPPKQVATPTGDGRVTITSEPWGAVYIDGTRVAAETPAYQLAVAAGVHQIKVFYPDTGTYSPTRTVTVRAGSPVSLGFKR